MQIEPACLNAACVGQQIGQDKAGLKQNGWSVVTAELGYVPKMFPTLDDTQRSEVGEFLQAIEDHDDVQHVWAAVK